MRLKKFLSTFGYNLGLAAPLLLIIAGLAAHMAIKSVGSASGAVSAGQISADGNSVKLDRKQIDPAMAMAAARRLMVLAPTPRIAVDGASIVVSTNTPEQYQEWVHALTTLQSTYPDVLWSATSLCLSQCEGNAPARAVVTGYRQRLTLH